jgi:tetratricopeptide (TPR) repeat protein
MYSHLGRFADVRTLAPTLDDEQQRDLARIIATAAIDGTDAAVRELSAFDQQRKRSYASGVAQLMMQVRLYPQAAALMELATQGTPAAAEQRQFIDILKKLKRAEDLPADDGPRGVIGKLFRALVFNDSKTMMALLPAGYSRDSKESPLDALTKLDLRPPDVLPLMVFGDLISSVFDVQQDGDDETGYRLRVRAVSGGSSDDDMSFFVRKVNGKWLFHGASSADPLTGATVLSMVEKGELEVARKWLNWARDDAKGGTNDDPLEGKPFAAIWPRSKQTATADELRIAAASLATDEVSRKKSEPILVAGREQVQGDVAKAAVDLALVTLYDGAKDWPKMLATTSRLMASHPDSATAFDKHIDALMLNGKMEEATAAATQRLERLPNDRDATHARALIAAHAGDYAAAQQYATEVVDKLRAKPEDFAFAAWVALFTGQQVDRAIEHAQHASKETKAARPDLRSLHALAGLYAATGRSVEARAALLKGIDDAHRGTLVDGDWYVLGRIAENYGVDDYAIAAYRKVKPGEGVATVSELAQRRLDGLGAGVKKKQ